MKKKTTKRIMIALTLSLIVISSFAQSKTIRVLDHSGDPIVGAAVKRYTTGWQNAVLTDANGEVTFTNGTRFEVSHNNTVFIDSYSLDGETVKVYTTLVTIKGYDDTATPLAGITNTYYKGAVRNFGATDASGTVSKELFPDTYSFTSTYNSTTHIRNVAVDGDGYTENTETIIKTYLSRVTFKATSFQNANVSGVGISYYKGGHINLPTTDANGESSRLLYPGEHTQFKASINSTSTDTFSITVPGNASIAETPAAKKITIPLYPIRVKFDNYDQSSNTTKVQYYPSSGLKSISGDTYYMFPGTYELIFPLKGTSTSYKRNVEITDNGTHNYQKVASIIRLTDHSGDPLAIESIRGGYGTNINYHVNTITNLPSPVSIGGDHVWIDLSNANVNTSRIFEVSKNSSTKTESKDVYTNNLFDFQTNLMTLRLETCDRTGLSGGAIRYGAGASITTHWGTSTDANGETSKELFEGSYLVEMKYNNSIETRTVTLVDNDVFTWTTQLVKINYPNSITYGGANGASNHFPGGKQQEMLPGIVNFKFSMAYGNVVTPITIPTTTSGVCNDLIITPVIFRLIDSNGNPLVGGEADYYKSPWTLVGETDANGVTILLLTNDNRTTITTRMKYGGLSLQQNNINIAANNHVITYQTKKITVKLLDYDNTPIVSDSNTVLYYGGTWISVGSGTTDAVTGEASDEFLPVSGVSFAVSLNGSREQRDGNNLSAITEIIFRATKVYAHYNDNMCNPVAGSEIEYYRSGWKNMGNTDASGMTAFTYLLPTTDAVIFRYKNTSSSQRTATILSQPEQHIYVGYCVDNMWIGRTDTDWNTTTNWSNDKIPSSEENISFAPYAERDLFVPDDAKIVGNLDNPSSKSLVIPADASLTVNGTVSITDATNPAKIQIKAASNKANGTLILNVDSQRVSAQPDVYATVDLYAKGYKSATEQTWTDNVPGSPTFGQSFTASYKWQYFGIPVQSVVASPVFAEGAIRQYHEDQNGSTFYDKWSNITNDNVLLSFKGYEITQNAPAIYSIPGMLVYGDQELEMTRNAPEVNGVRYGLGQNLFGNSFTASISVDDIVFPEEAEKVVYLYNTGSIADWNGELGETNDGNQMVAGQYTAIPKEVASAVFDGKIPSMNGFVVMFNDANTVVGDAKSLTVKYNSVSKNSRPQTAPRAPLSWLEIGLESQSTIDKLWLISSSDVEEKVSSNGWNGRKFFGTPTAFIYSESSTGPMQVHTKENLDGAVLSFYANNDEHYNLIINRSNLQGYDNLKLIDLV